MSESHQIAFPECELAWHEIDDHDGTVHVTQAGAAYALSPPRFVSH